MKARLALRISAICFILLGLLVLQVLWITPEILPGADTSEEVITTARAWGDVNATIFVSFGIFLIILSGIDNLIFIQRVLFANTLLTIPMLGIGIFHHVYLNSGPPPPVFILVTLSGLFSLYGWKKGL